MSLTSQRRKRHRKAQARKQTILHQFHLTSQDRGPYVEIKVIVNGMRMVCERYILAYVKNARRLGMLSSNFSSRSSKRIFLTSKYTLALR